MKNLIQKALTIFTNAKLHSTHSFIKGNKSGGTVDMSGYKHWYGEGSGGVTKVK
jgi:hypothetical protein